MRVAFYYYARMFPSVSHRRVIASYNRFISRSSDYVHELNYLRTGNSFPFEWYVCSGVVKFLQWQFRRRIHNGMQSLCESHSCVREWDASACHIFKYSTVHYKTAATGDIRVKCKI